ncbi:BamA/TamA family outer membrane protein [Candidatus Babeliales bacterium]|nr:BamA/TamA family outer membrane protein [Candidatus Babeliales bacterium]
MGRKTGLCVYKYLLFILSIFFATLGTLPLHGRTKQCYGGNFHEQYPQETATFYLTKLSHQADILLSSEEFNHLVELVPNTFISVKQVNQAFKNLMRKERLQAIDINCCDYENGKHLTFTLKSSWILKKLTFKGVFFGQQEYTNLYTQQPGDVFDISLHEESVEAINQKLKAEGYFDHTLTDEFVYEKKNKTITAIIKTKRGKRYHIDQVSFDIKTDQEQAHERTPTALAEKLQRFKKNLLKTDYDKRQIEKQAKKIRTYLQEKGYFDSHISMKRLINHRNHTVAVTFFISLGKRKLLAFTGNHLFSNQAIKEDIIGLDLPEWLFSPDIITEQLLHEYYKKGYWQTAISYKPTPKHDYVFSIQEGSPTHINHIFLKNVDTREQEREGLHFFNELLKKKTFDQERLDTALSALKHHYFSQGFWNFEIVETRFVKQQDDSYAILVLIKKGAQHFYHGFAFKNFEHLASHSVFTDPQKSTTNNLVPFNIHWLHEQKVYLLNYFQQNSYWYARVHPELTSKISPHGVDVFTTWHIEPGPRVRFGKVYLRGATKLPFKRIMREVRCHEGALWDKEKIELTRKKLRSLDIFKQIQIQPYHLSNTKSKKPLIITLVDDDPIELRIRAGYFLTSKNFLFKRQSTAKFGASLAIKNPTNRADNLTINTEITRFERTFDAHYQQPALLGLPVMGKLKGYTNKYIHPVAIGSSDSAYEAVQSGFLAGLSDEYRENYYWGITLGNEWMRTSRVRGNLNLDPALIDRTLPYFFFEPSLIIDTLDDRVNTTKGQFSFLSMKFMVPELAAGFSARLMAEQSYFKALHNNVIGAFRLRFGHIFRRKFNQIMPIERFYLGGPYSVRGYEKDSLPPLGVSEHIDSEGNVSKEYTIQGGSSMINLNLELRFPVIDKLGMVIFQDVGVLSQTGIPGSGSWFPGSGCGLRYKTPVGAIRFDIGWKWKTRLPGDSAYAWYLTLGEVF